MGYHEPVREMLAGRATVVRARNANERPENCQGTTHGVKHLARWLATDGGGFDVIHFNFGLHDLKRVDAETGKNSNDPGDPHQASPELYGSQLREIVEVLQTTGARLVFATTTPVPPGGVKPHRDPGDVVLFNEVARRVMSDHDVPIDDLYGFALPRLAELQQPVNVHFSPAGSRALAEQVVASILEVAGLRSGSPR